MSRPFDPQARALAIKRRKSALHSGAWASCRGTSGGDDERLAVPPATTLATVALRVSQLDPESSIERRANNTDGRLVAVKGLAPATQPGSRESMRDPASDVRRRENAHGRLAAAEGLPPATRPGSRQSQLDPASDIRRRENKRKPTPIDPCESAEIRRSFGTSSNGWESDSGPRRPPTRNGTQGGSLPPTPPRISPQAHLAMLEVDVIALEAKAQAAAVEVCHDAHSLHRPHLPWRFLTITVHHTPRPPPPDQAHSLRVAAVEARAVRDAMHKLLLDANGDVETRESAQLPNWPVGPPPNGPPLLPGARSTHTSMTRSTAAANATHSGVESASKDST